MVDYTTVVGVDAKHLQQLAMVWPTWCRWKSDIPKHPMIIFFDRFSVHPHDVRNVCDHPNLQTVAWPPDGVVYPGHGTDKWHDPDPQRQKMLAGFVYVGGNAVQTKYWLKLDTDTVATGFYDWIDEGWFKDEPAIACQKWNYTKPANQFQLLDKWADEHGVLGEPVTPRIGVPKEGSSRIGHKRIISWCGFFNTEFSFTCSNLAREFCGPGMLPVWSQDGYMWYLARRMNLPIVRFNVKPRGWLHRNSMRSIADAAMEAMA